VDRGVKIALVAFSRTAQASKELSVVKGEYLEVSWPKDQIFLLLKSLWNIRILT
jgi:hypothetical protein